MFMSIVRSRNARIYSIHTQFEHLLRDDQYNAKKSSNTQKKTRESIPLQTPHTIIVKGSRWTTSIPREACSVLA